MFFSTPTQLRDVYIKKMGIFFKNNFCLRRLFRYKTGKSFPDGHFRLVHSTVLSRISLWKYILQLSPLTIFASCLLFFTVVWSFAKNGVTSLIASSELINYVE